MRDYGTPFEEMTTAELDRLRADISISLALAAPGSAVAVPAERQLRAIAAVVAAREHGDVPGMRQPFPGQGGKGAL